VSATKRAISRSVYAFGPPSSYSLAERAWLPSASAKQRATSSTQIGWKRASARASAITGIKPHQRREAGSRSRRPRRR
jgi:hypothetical protein